ncbi:MAG: hypothetical protein AB1489_11500 [Acidobacteriota bacterium]
MEDRDSLTPMGGSQRWVQQAEMAWAGLAFNEPGLSGARIEPIKESARITPEQEIAFYTDWQTRDSELGLALIDAQKFDLLKTTSTLRNGLQRRLRAASVARTRYQALEMINAGEPNPALRYSEKIFQDIQAEVTRLAAEVTYLQAFSTRIDSLHQLVTLLLNTPSGSASPELEQCLRLLGQSWRGLMRIKAFSERVPKSNQRLPALTVFQPDYMNFSGYIISVAGIKESLIITAETAAYLLSQLETIARLAEAVENQSADRTKTLDSWFPSLTLVRAIVEFFYFCNFELPFAYAELVLDGTVSDKVWTYNDQWIGAKEDVTSVRHLKRMSMEVAILLTKHEQLLKCCIDAELTELLSREIQPLSQHTTPTRMLYQPYWSVGLANFEFAESEQRVRFHTAPEIIGGLVENLLTDQPQLARLANSQLGGALDTLLGLALLDERAFIASKLELETRTRYELMARFWRSIGRRRAIVMLGNGYVQAISEALEVLGQPGPEHPTFLTIHFGDLPSNATNRSLSSSLDPFSSLVLADQLRLIELLNLTWNLGEKFFAQLAHTDVVDELSQVITALPAMAAQFENELRVRLNESWLVSLDRVWTLLRSSAPVLWDFWSKIKGEENWQLPILSAPTADAIGLMLRLFGDSLRLLMLVEMSSAMMITRLRYNSEPISQLFYRTMLPFQANDPDHTSILTQVVDYYFDAEIRFDTALAFASAFRQHLEHILADLKMLGAPEEHYTLFVSVICQLEQNYNLVQKAALTHNS